MNGNQVVESKYGNNNNGTSILSSPFALDYLALATRISDTEALIRQIVATLKRTPSPPLDHSERNYQFKLFSFFQN